MKTGGEVMDDEQLNEKSKENMGDARDEMKECGAYIEGESEFHLAGNYYGFMQGRRACEANDGWQPIATAPKDGTPMICWCPYWGVVSGLYWDTNEYAKKPRPYWSHHMEMIWGTGSTRANQPTHWMPAPTAPTQGPRTT
jgi:hypothetical protein